MACAQALPAAGPVLSGSAGPLLSRLSWPPHGLAGQESRRLQRGRPPKSAAMALGGDSTMQRSNPRKGTWAVQQQHSPGAPSLPCPENLSCVQHMALRRRLVLKIRLFLSTYLLNNSRWRAYLSVQRMKSCFLENRFQ